MYKIIGFCNLHNSPNLGELTESRTLASTSFLGRYAFVDFILSNFSNSGIDEVGILAKDHIRSINKHLGFARAWNINTKLGANTVLFNEQYANNPLYNHDLNNIQANDWFLIRSKADYVVIAPVHFICPINYKKIIDEHIRSNAEITMVYVHADNCKTHYLSCDLIEVNDGDKVTKINKNKGLCDKGNVSMEMYVMDRDYFESLLKEVNSISSIFSLNDYLSYNYSRLNIHAYEYKGYVRCFDSLEHYLEYSLELLNYNVRKSLFLEDWPIFTLTHDTPPTKYGKTSKVRNSFVANGAIIQGEVENSIISRSVIVSEGAKIKNSIILTETIIASDMCLDHVVVDKYARVIHAKNLKGTKDSPLYLKQGDVV